MTRQYECEIIGSCPFSKDGARVCSRKESCPKPIVIPSGDPFDGDGYREYYKDPGKVREDLFTAHNTMCNRNTTRESWEQMEKCLGLIIMYCPESLRGMAEGFLLEANLRKPYFENKFWRNI